jgi:transposase InsO family protein
MTITMDDKQITTTEQVAEVLRSSQGIEFKVVGREQLYVWIESVMDRFDYFELSRKGKGLLKRYLQRFSGFSRAQLTRLMLKNRVEGSIRPSRAPRNRFPAKYTAADNDLLAQTDNVHGRLSGPATKKILERQFAVYGDKRFERLQGISIAHIYNLRSNPAYNKSAQTFTKTKGSSRSIGIRRKPQPQGRPGYIRVDTVHQGDWNGKKGVYHINLVDTVTQWEIVACTETISEEHLNPVLKVALAAFPFVIRNFHSDNGSEFINVEIAKLLEKLLIEQTKSRSGKTNDNALVESKNGSVIRKHLGYWHIDRRHAPLINRFYQKHFNVYLNFHRPCGFATVTIDDKGRRRRKYETYQTPHERLRSLEKAGSYLRSGISLKTLDDIAARQTDNEAAAAMQEARHALFKTLGTAVHGRLAKHRRLRYDTTKAARTSSPSQTRQIFASANG